MRCDRWSDWSSYAVFQLVWYCRGLMTPGIAHAGDNIGGILVRQLLPELRHVVGVRDTTAARCTEPLSATLMSEGGSSSSTPGCQREPAYKG